MAVDGTMAYAAREPGKPGYVAVCVDEPKYADAIADFITENIAEGYVIEHVTRSAAVVGFKEYASMEREKNALARHREGA